MIVSLYFDILTDGLKWLKYLATKQRNELQKPILEFHLLHFKFQFSTICATIAPEVGFSVEKDEEGEIQRHVILI